MCVGEYASTSVCVCVCVHVCTCVYGGHGSSSGVIHWVLPTLLGFLGGGFVVCFGVCICMSGICVCTCP